MKLPTRRLCVRSILILLIAQSVFYFLKGIPLIREKRVMDVEVFYLAVSTLSQQVGWIVALGWAFVHLDRRTPIMIAVAACMITGNLLCSFSQWMDGNLLQASLNSIIGFLLCAMVVGATRLRVN